MLPFKVSPEVGKTRLVGTERTGILEFPVFFSLLVSEQVEIDNELNRLSPFSLAAELAIKISNEQKLGLLMCSEAVIGGDTFKSESDLQIIREQRIRYARDIEAINNYSETFSQREKLIVVTAIMRRIMPEWRLDDTKKLTVGLFKFIWEFAQSEVNAQSPISNIQYPITEEAIKKPQHLESQAAQIGLKSFGGSESIGQMIPDFSVMSSDSNPVG